MFVSGFSFIRNAVKFDYPIIEAITSILPLCDEFVVAVGNSDDNTEELIKSINSDKIKIISTVWDDSKRTGGIVLAEETNKAFKNISKKADWAFYIQGDEVLHEKYIDTVREYLHKYKDDNKLDGFLFRYRHFYGSYDYVGESYRWYRNEIRIIKNKPEIYSYRDAQGFRKGKNQKLNVVRIPAEIYHYGWVKHPELQQLKQQEFNKLWHDDSWIENNIVKSSEFDYSNIDSLELFKETHPAVMQSRIDRQNWKFDHDISFKRYSSKEKIKRIVEKFTGLHIGEYKNYKLVK